MRTIPALALGIFLLMGCAAPEREPVVIVENRFFRCEPALVVKEEMVTLINRARSSRHRCGRNRFHAASRVRWNSRLARAALEHSRDMARNNFLGHTGSDGSSVGERLTGFGYAWSSVAENISGGRQTSEEAVSAWLKSPDHCANMMNPNFTEIGAACFRNSSSEYGTYWTLVLASPAK